ncbi:hypothetical protein GOODEAATRI_008925, partial [Goodea atripinnis]
LEHAHKGWSRVFFQPAGITSELKEPQEETLVPPGLTSKNNHILSAAMRRTTLTLPRVQPLPRAARKSEWLRSALVHHYCPDPGAENEIVVLATGIDQYLQEVFHHLAYPNQDDTVSAEDFTALCAVLGLKAEEGSRDGGTDQQHEEFRDVCSKLSDQLSFKEFHSRLCGYFRVRSASAVTGDCDWRLPVSGNTELVERQIRLRWPRGSDARCLALEVALRRERSRTLTAPYDHSTSVSTPKSSSTLMQGKLVQTDKLKGQPGGSQEGRTRRGQRRWDTRDPILRELKLIRSSRNGQLEEAMKFNECLEEELQWAYQEMRTLQGLESSLRRENSQIRCCK